MNALIWSWLKGVRNPILKILLGVLIIAVVVLWREFKTGTKNRENVDQNTTAEIISEREYWKTKYLECQDSRYNDLKNQAERLDRRIEKQDSAKQILK